MRYEEYIRLTGSIKFELILADLGLGMRKKHSHVYGKQGIYIYRLLMQKDWRTFRHAGWGWDRRKFRLISQIYKDY